MGTATISPAPTRVVRPLERFLNPRTIAVLGACEDPASLGRTVLLNLTGGGFAGAVHAVDRRGGRVLGVDVHADIAPLAGRIDLAVICVAPEAVADALGDCIAARIPAAVVMTGDDIDPALITACRLDGLRLLGPGSFGLINPRVRLNATCASGMPAEGNIAFLSQSGGMCSAILDWSRGERFGFSAVVAVGAMRDVGWGELLDWCATDAATASVVIAMESFGDVRAFLAAAREIAVTKHVIALKARRTTIGAGARHRGSDADSDAVVDAAFRKAGVLRAESIEEMFYLADALAKQPRPRGQRLAVLGNASGPAVLATDALAAAGGELAVLIPATLAGIRQRSGVSLANPIYLGADAGPDDYRAAAAAVRMDPGVDGLLAILAPQEMSDPVACADALISATSTWDKPVFASWMGGPRVAEARDHLSAAGVFQYAFPDGAARTFAQLSGHARVLDAMYATPMPRSGSDGAQDQTRVADLLDDARRGDRTCFTAHEAAGLLAAYGIPVAAPALVVADAIALPLPADGRAQAWELCVGFRSYPDVGPVLLFGVGGRLSQVIDDRAVDVAPLDHALARRLVERTRLGRELARDGRYDLAAIDDILTRLSALACDHPRIASVEINPLVLNQGGPIAVEVQVELHPWTLTNDELPGPAMRPYPAEYATPWTLFDGTPVLIRPIRPEDETRLADFHQTLSSDTVMERYFHHLPVDQRTAHHRLARICFSDYGRDLVLVVEHGVPYAEHAIIAVARLSRSRCSDEAELATVVADTWQHRGLGSKLIRILVDIGRREGVGTITSWTLPTNLAMQRLLAQAGFAVAHQPGEPLCYAELRLKDR